MPITLLEGNWLLDSDCVNTRCSAGASSSANSLSTRLGMLSGPDALLTHSSLRSFLTPSTLMSSVGMGG